MQKLLVLYLYFWTEQQRTNNFPPMQKLNNLNRLGNTWFWSHCASQKFGINKHKINCTVWATLCMRKWHMSYEHITGPTLEKALKSFLILWKGWGGSACRHLTVEGGGEGEGGWSQLISVVKGNWQRTRMSAVIGHGLAAPMLAIQRGGLREQIKEECRSLFPSVFQIR